MTSNLPSCFTPAELAELRAADARMDASTTTATARTVWRERPTCPQCGALRFTIATTKTDASGNVTRYCRCVTCDWRWRLIDLAPAQ